MRDQAFPFRRPVVYPCCRNAAAVKDCGPVPGLCRPNIRNRIQEISLPYRTRWFNGFTHRWPHLPLTFPWSVQPSRYGTCPGVTRPKARTANVGEMPRAADGINGCHLVAGPRRPGCPERLRGNGRPTAMRGWNAEQKAGLPRTWRRGCRRSVPASSERALVRGERRRSTVPSLP